MSEEDFCSVEEFLEKFKGKLQIPSYQRDYAWEAEQVRQLIEDVEATPEGEYFLGTLILHHKPGDASWDVVDGQQRLRTLAALLGEDEGAVFKPAPKQEKQGRTPQEVVGQVCRALSRETEERLRACKIASIVVDDLDDAFQLFDTQNGRGKPLSVENLLKAYHYGAMARGRMPSPERLAELERRWEEEIADEQSEKRVEGLLTALLFLARRGCRGEEKKVFSRQEDLGEFQGVTLGVDKALPAHNVSRLCEVLLRGKPSEAADLRLRWGCERLANGLSLDCDPAAQANGLIVNGEAFFAYATTYARLARRLFPKEGRFDSAQDCRSETLRAFHAFYRENCFYEGWWRVGDGYARTVYEALILLLVDRFGEAGLGAHHRQLWRLAYHERFSRGRLMFGAAGNDYFRQACRAIASAATLPALGRALSRLEAEQRERVEEGTLSPFNDESSAVCKTMKAERA